MSCTIIAGDTELCANGKLSGQVLLRGAEAKWHDPSFRRQTAHVKQVSVKLDTEGTQTKILNHG